VYISGPQYRLHPAPPEGIIPPVSASEWPDEIQNLFCPMADLGVERSMSRRLPDRPNLEHLKKQAKQRLSQLRQHTPTAKLADAQQAVARDYGFVSWPQLRAFVDSLPVPRPASRARPAGSNALAGRWVAVLSLSIRHPLNEYRSATLDVSVEGDVVTIDDLVVDTDGRSERTRNVLHADGELRVFDRDYAMKAQWQTDRTLQVVVMKRDVLESVVTYEVSANGQALTLIAGEQRHTFERG
jgi:hypothetical protein